MDLKLNHPDINRLFTLTTYTDPEAGNIIKVQSMDPGYPLPKWRGSTVINGQVEVGFDIPGASSLETAVALWPKFAHEAVIDALEQMRSQTIRQSIIAPGRKPQ